MASCAPEQSSKLPNSDSISNAEKQKLIQKQMILIIHAHKCLGKDKEEMQKTVLSSATGTGPDAVYKSKCELPHCQTMKDLLSHMSTCAQGKDCADPLCVSSRQIITHFKCCTAQDCSVCAPLKARELKSA